MVEKIFFDRPEDEREMSRPLFIALLTGAFLLAGFIQWYWIWKGLYAFSADESGHTLDAYLWMRNKSLLSGVWLPLYTVVVGLALQIHPDLVVTPRVVNFVIGLFVLGALCWLIAELVGWKRRRVIVFTAILGAVNPERVLLSVVPLTEIMLAAAVITGCAFFARWLSSGKTAAFVLASCFFGVASAIRYEGWIFAGVFFLYVLFVGFRGKTIVQRRVIRYACLIVAAFPLFWIGVNAFGASDPTAFLRVPSENYRHAFGSDWSALIEHSVLAQFLLQNAASWNLIGVLSLVSLTLTNRTIRRWTIVPWSSLLIITVSSIMLMTLPNHSFWRIPSAWSILLVPFTAYWVSSPIGRFQQLGPVGKRILLVVAAGLVIMQSVFQTAHMARQPNFTVDELRAGYRLEELIDADRTSLTTRPSILIETSDWKYLHIVIASQRPEEFIYDSGRDPGHPSSSFLLTSMGKNESVIESNGIRYIVVRNEGLKQSLGAMISLKRQGDFGEWSIFQRMGRTPG